MDESSNSELFTLASITSHGGQWWHFENAWTNWLEKQNAELRQQSRKTISRFKASDCSCFKNEFSDWTKEEQVRFLEGALTVLGRHTMVMFSYTCQLRDFEDQFPEANNAHKTKALAYAILLYYLMKDMGERILGNKKYSSESISIVHDQTAGFDAVLLDAFNDQLADENFKFRKQFTTIAPMSWKDCVLLQPADLIAYENFKISERVHSGHGMRKIMEYILDLRSVGGRGAELTPENVRTIRGSLTKDQLHKLFAIARIKTHRS